MAVEPGAAARPTRRDRRGSPLPRFVAACRCLLAGLILLAGAVATVHAAGAPRVAGPVGSEGALHRQQVWLIPSPQAGVLMRSTLYRPPGKGPFPLVVINHGSVEDPDARALMRMPTFPALTDWFVARGYAVLVPVRPGHGPTGGRYAESEGRCGAPDFVKAGTATADSIAAAIAYMTGQPFIRRAGVIVVGNSAGGWGALALASRNPKGVRAVISFAGGRGGREHDIALNNCGPERLVAAAAQFGGPARLPTLWLYAANDTYFPPKLSRRLADAYAAAGGKVEYHLLPPIGREGHVLIQTPAVNWAAYLDAFLAAHR